MLLAEGRLEQLYTCLQADLPPRALLQVLYNNSGSSLAAEFEALFEQTIQRLSRSSYASAQSDVQLEEKFLKKWVEHSSQVPENYRVALARKIVNDDENEERWIRFCLPYLDQPALGQPCKHFTAKLKALVEVTADDLKEESQELRGIRDLKYLSNLTLSLLDGDRYDWAYLNLARLSIGYDDLAACLDEEQQRGDQDEFASWHFEKALPAGAEFSELDKLIAAQISLNKGNYSRALDLLSNCRIERDKNLSSRYEGLLAIIHARLSLDENTQGDPGLALGIFNKRIQDKKASNGEKYLACRLYMKVKDKAKAKAVFAALDYHKLSSEARPIIEIAWELGLQENIAEFLLHQLRMSPGNLFFNEMYIDYLRNFLFDYAAARVVIDSLRSVDSEHPWITVLECDSALDRKETSSAQRMLFRIPDTRFWRDEKLLIAGRIDLQNNQIELAKRNFQRIGNKNRPDAAFWSAVISAHLNDIPKAHEALQAISDNPFLKEQILYLQGKLYLAQGEYSRALEVFGALPDELVTIEKVVTLIQLGKYDQVLTLTNKSDSTEAHYFQAVAFDKKGDIPSALIHYKSFLSASRDSAPYLDAAVNRIAQLLVHQKEKQDIEWLVTQKSLLRRIPVLQRIDLFACLGKWHEVIALLNEVPEAQTENQITAYERVLAHNIASCDWEEATAIAEKLERLDKSGKYLDEVLFCQFLSEAQLNDSTLINADIYKRSKEKTLKIALGLYHQLKKDTVMPAFSGKVALWADEKMDCDEAQLINFIVHCCCLPEDQLTHFINKHEQRLQAIQNEAHRQLIQLLIYLVRGQSPPAIEDVLSIYNKGADSFPLTWRTVWFRFISRYIQNDMVNPAAAMQLLEQMASLDMPVDLKLVLYTKQARSYLKQKQEVLALQSLEKALD